MNIMKFKARWVLILCFLFVALVGQIPSVLVQTAVFILAWSMLLVILYFVNRS